MLRTTLETQRLLVVPGSPAQGNARTQDRMQCGQQLRRTIEHLGERITKEDLDLLPIGFRSERSQFADAPGMCSDQQLPIDPDGKAPHAPLKTIVPGPHCEGSEIEANRRRKIPRRRW